MATAALFVGPGRPVELVDRPAPEPRGAEVVVRVRLTTLCRSDLHTHAGRRSEPTPTVLGHEAVGEIAAFGPDAVHTDWSGEPATVGDRVTWAVAVGCGACGPCGDDLPQKCVRPYKYGHVQTPPAAPWTGGLAEYVVLVPRTAWFRVPAGLPDRVAAPANCATATVAALAAAGPAAGRTVLVLGAGVLGAQACAMARAAGAAAVLACDPAADCRDRAARFGATHTCGPDALPMLLADATAGRGADAVLELSGAAAAVAAALDAARVGGTAVLAGSVAPGPAVPLDPERVVRRLLTIRGVHNYRPPDLAAALAFLAGPGRAYPFAELVADEFPLADVDAALAAAHARPGRRVAVRPGPGATR